MTSHDVQELWRLLNAMNRRLEAMDTAREKAQERHIRMEGNQQALLDTVQRIDQRTVVLEAEVDKLRARNDREDGASTLRRATLRSVAAVIATTGVFVGVVFELIDHFHHLHLPG